MSFFPSAINLFTKYALLWQQNPFLFFFLRKLLKSLVSFSLFESKQKYNFFTTQLNKVIKLKMEVASAIKEESQKANEESFIPDEDTLNLLSMIMSRLRIVERNIGI